MILQINFNVKAVASVTFEISKKRWDSLSEENQKMVLIHFAREADLALFRQDSPDEIGVSVEIPRDQEIDTETVDIDEYSDDEEEEEPIDEEA